MKSIVFTLVCSLLSSVQLVQGQFGMNKQVPNNPLNDAPVLYDDDVDMGLLDDPELAEAMQMFADMSPEEMAGGVEELKEMFKDDPETLKDLEEVMQELSNLSSDDMEERLQEIMQEEAVAYAMTETLEMLQAADEEDLEKIISQKDIVLESVIQTGAISEEEIEFFKSNPDEWEKELRHIWGELNNQADTPQHDEL
mmetsp:Transcript_23849/g.27609  ORF Transcript_23849/g.27609 Transcript_23849/m.27609 type:complete len:197 (-) Transcript_23849:37-627(-)